MMPIKIFCEGITDQVFIADCIENFYNIKVERKENKSKKDSLLITFPGGGEIIEVGGCSRLTNEIFIQKMKENIDMGGLNIVIFDADYPNDAEGDKKGSGNNGFSSCTQKLDDIKLRHGVDFEYSIWPDHAGDGEIENLLLKLIPTSKMPIFDCVNAHQECLKASKIENLRIAQLKDLLGYYLHTCNETPKPGNRNYRNDEYWDLTHSDLSKFRMFLDRFFISVPNENSQF